MPKLTKEERELRRNKVQKEALETVAARGQFNFRLDGEDIKRLHALASNRETPVSKMVREWVLERLELEEKKQYASPLWAQAMDKRLRHTELLLIALSALDSASDEVREQVRIKVKNHIRTNYGDLDSESELLDLLA